MTLVVKYGGGAMSGGGSDEADPVLAELAMLRAAGSAVVLVHGGGPEIDAALAQRDIASERIDGQRVTDASTLSRDVQASFRCQFGPALGDKRRLVGQDVERQGDDRRIQ